MRYKRLEYKKILMALAATLDGVLGVLSLSISLLAMAISPSRIFRIVGGIFLVSLIMLLGVTLFWIRHDPKTKNWKMKRFIELPIISKKRCVIFSCIPLALSIFLFVSLFFLK